MVDDLKQIVLCVLENDKDALFFQDYLHGMHDVGVRKLSAECHFSDGRLRNSGVLQFAFLVRLESAWSVSSECHSTK